MTTAYTSLLGLALPVTGELSGTWGDTVNDAITSLLDTAVAGTTTISTDADTVLTTTTGAANQARQAVILWSPASGTVTRNITAPAQSKIYIVINASGGTQSIVFRGVGPTTGVTIVKGESAVCAWNGSDFIKISNNNGAGTFTNLTVTGNTTLGDAVGDTITINGTTTFANANPVLTPGTANGVAYLNGSKVLTTGSALTFDGSTFTAEGLVDVDGVSGSPLLRLRQTTAGAGTEFNTTITENTGVTFDCTDGGTTARSFIWSQVGSEQMRLTSTGLGIGTSSPSNKLTVSGTGTVTRLISSNTGVYLGLQTSDNSGNYIGSASGATVFQTNDTERMRIDTSGSLGLGVTPSTGGYGIAFQFAHAGNGGGITAQSISTNNYPVNLTSNAISSGSSTWKYFNTDGGSATRYQQVAGAHSWFTAPSGTAGNAISFTQAMTLDASGNLGVGTTSPLVASGWTTITLNNASNGGIIELQSNGTGSGRIIGSSSEFGLYARNNKPLVIYTNPSGSDVERVRIDSSGNVGIGTSSPGAKLDINPGSSGGFMQVYNPANTNTARLRAANSQSWVDIGQDGTGGYLEQNGAYPYRFFVNGSERFRIASAGQLGIGGANYGTSGQVLTSNGAASAPSWQNVGSGTVTSVSGTGTVSGLTLSGTVTTSGSLTLGGTLSVAALSTASGSAPSYSARAWVNFNGTGTVAIRASGNVSSITDNGTGDYTVNFTTAMPDANYAGQVCIGTVGASDGVGGGFSAATLIAASFRIRTLNASQSASKDFDAVYVNVHR